MSLLDDGCINDSLCILPGQRRCRRPRTGLNVGLIYCNKSFHVLPKQLIASKDVNGGRLFVPRKNWTRVTTTLEVSLKKGEFEKEGEFEKICLKRGTSGLGVSKHLRRPRIFCMVSGSSEMISYGSPNICLMFA
jgi:hypothetical protein